MIAILEIIAVLTAVLRFGIALWGHESELAFWTCLAAIWMVRALVSEWVAAGRPSAPK